MHGRDDDPLTYDIIGAAIKVHRHWGPGFLEAVYKKSLQVELVRRGFDVRVEVPFPLSYDGVDLGTCYRADLVCEDVLIELKAADGIHDFHIAQVVRYLRASGLRRGLLLNFGLPMLQKRRVIVSAGAPAGSGSSVDSVFAPPEQRGTTSPATT